jgi:predicted HTH transcriptional regulator
MLENLQSLREGNRLEVKEASGGLPRSLWETYSAFANTSGGTILLGVREQPDHSFQVVGVDRPEKLVDDFWNTVNNPQKVSANILMDGDVRVVDCDGAAVVEVSVPRAPREDRPVYLNDHPKRSVRRNHSGDYLCKYDEVVAMMRDAAASTQDGRVVEGARLDDLDAQTLRRYRNAYALGHSGHPWNGLSDEEFLQAVGAADADTDGTVHPTGAGLLMFGRDRWIAKEFPQYFLDYRQETGGEERWQDRFTSQSGDWSGNLYDFYHRAYNALKQALRVPFKLNGVERQDDTPAHQALREALVNCLTNANYCERRGVVCLWTDDAIAVANPGGFRMDVSVAMRPGESDPRNAVVLKLFSLVNAGERAGSGISKIMDGWRAAGYGTPSYTEEFCPDRTTLVLPLAPADGGQADWPRQGSTQTEASPAGKPAGRERVLELAAQKPGGLSRADVVSRLGYSPSGASKVLSGLVADGALVAEGSGRARVYRLA